MLAIKRYAVLRRALGFIADIAEIATEPAINHYFESGGDVLALRLTSRRRKLQILRGSRIVAGLRGL